MAYGGDHRGAAINIIDWTFTGVTSVVVAMRIFSRLSVGTFGRDDALILFSMAVVVMYVCSLTAAVAAGYGEHFQEIAPEKRPLVVYRVIVCSCIAVLTFGPPKLAIVSLLERLLELRAPTRILFWSLSALLMVSSVVLSIFWFVQCTPRAYQWDPVHVTGSCWDPKVVLYLSYVVGVYSGVLDVLFAVFPPFVIWRLQMSRGKKIFISASLGGGLIAAVTAFYKITTVEGLNEAAKSDPTWANVPLLIWTSIEAHLLIITASLPTIGPCLRSVRKQYRHYVSSSSGLEGSTLRSKSYGYQSDRRATHQRSYFSNRSNHLPSEQNVPLVDIERSASGNFPHDPHKARFAHNNHGILKETAVEVRHGSPNRHF